MKHATRILAPIMAAALTLAAAGAAQAQAVRSERNMSLELANQIAGATVAACLAGGYNVTVAVVDRAGQLRALQRADNAGPHTIEAAQAKAYTSASAKIATLAMMESAQKNPGAAKRAARRILEAAAVLREQPELGRLVEGEDFRDLVAPFGAGAYVLRYRIDDDAVVVASVWHTREERG